MDSFAPMCLFCKHLNKDDVEKHSCAAFPDGIPEKIFWWAGNHKKPWPGDNNIQFEPRKYLDKDDIQYFERHYGKLTED